MCFVYTNGDSLYANKEIISESRNEIKVFDYFKHETIFTRTILWMYTQRTEDLNVSFENIIKIISLFKILIIAIPDDIYEILFLNTNLTKEKAEHIKNDLVEYNIDQNEIEELCFNDDIPNNCYCTEKIKVGSKSNYITTFDDYCFICKSKTARMIIIMIWIIVNIEQKHYWNIYTIKRCVEHNKINTIKNNSRHYIIITNIINHKESDGNTFTVNEIFKSLI